MSDVEKGETKNNTNILNNTRFGCSSSVREIDRSIFSSLLSFLWYNKVTTVVFATKPFSLSLLSSFLSSTTVLPFSFPKQQDYYYYNVMWKKGSLAFKSTSRCESTKLIQNKIVVFRKQIMFSEKSNKKYKHLWFKQTDN